MTYQASTSTLIWSTSMQYINISNGNGISPLGSSIINTNSHSLDITGDANFNGDIKWKGRSLSEFLKSIEDRLAILVPDQAKLQHFEALQKAYQHYKTLEALCQIPNKEEK